MGGHFRRLMSEVSPETLSMVMAAAMSVWSTAEVPKIVAMVPRLRDPATALARKVASVQGKLSDHEFEELFLDPMVAKLVEEGVSVASCEKIQQACRALWAEPAVRRMLPWIAKKMYMLTPDMRTVHMGVVCDVCEVSPIVGLRYRCSKCADFDACGGCFEALTESAHADGSHSKDADFCKMMHPWDPKLPDQPRKLVPDAPLRHGDFGVDVVHLKTVLAELKYFPEQGLQKWHAPRFGGMLAKALADFKRQYELQDEDGGSTYDALTRATLLSVVESEATAASKPVPMEAEAEAGPSASPLSGA